MTTGHQDRTLERYAQEYANDPEFIAEGLATTVTDEMLELLEERGLTQSWLATEMGVSRSLISRILNAPPNMTLLTIARIAVALGVTPDIRLNAARSQRPSAVRSIPSPYEDWATSRVVIANAAETPLHTRPERGAFNAAS